MVVDKNEISLSGVIGDPIAHSKSPLIQNFWIKKSKLEGYYIPIRIPKGEIKKKIRFVKELGFRGLNVTVPHKVDAFYLADKLTIEAKKVGAVNTLYFEDGLIIGDNTDTFGFKTCILRNFPFYNFKKEKVLVYGAGGAARAILSVFVNEKTSEIRLINRSKERAIELKEVFSNSIKVFDWKKNNEALDGVTTVVNTTSLGNLGNEPFSHTLKGVKKNAVGVDLVYNPLETSFMKIAKKENINCINGLDMLVYQAMPGFKRWFKKKPVYSKELRELLEISFLRR